MWLLPSRQRPEHLRRFFDAYRETGADSQGVVWLDGDDYDKYSDIDLPGGWHFIIHARLDSVGALTNEFFRKFPDEPWYGLLGDDVIPRTQGWDRKLIDAAGNDGLSYGNDRLYARASHPVVGGDLVRELGWLALPGCKRIYIDNALEEAARRRGKVAYLNNVIVEHMHWSNGKRTKDIVDQKEGNLEDQKVYEAWLKTLEKPVTFACVNWGNYCDRGTEYVNILFDMVRRNICSGYPGKFVCFTDQPDGLDSYIEARALPEGMRGWWNKLYLFKEGVFEEGERVIYLDLDTCITGSLDRIIQYDGEFAILRDFYKLDKYGPGAMMWRGGFGKEIWSSYEDAGFPTEMEWGDWDWINSYFENTSYKPQILQDIFPNEVVSFKVQARHGIPKHAKIVCFHGLPRPHQADGWVPYIWKLGGGSSLDLVTIANISEEKIVENIEAAMQLPYPLLQQKEAHDRHAVIIGGGPSLFECLEEIKFRQSAGQHIFASNNSYKYLKMWGIKPDYHVMLDARAENAEFVPYAYHRFQGTGGVNDDVQLLYSSQCDPHVFDKAAKNGYSPIIWHSHAGGIERIVAAEDRAFTYVGGGSSVSLKAMAIAYIMGYRSIHLYGMDSSYRGESHHAYSQAPNDDERTISVICNGKEYKTAPWMATQVDEFKELSAQLVGLGCIITVHGDGLLQDVAKLMAA